MSYKRTLYSLYGVILMSCESTWYSDPCRRETVKQCDEYTPYGTIIHCIRYGIVDGIAACLGPMLDCICCSISVRPW